MAAEPPHTHKGRTISVYTTEGKDGLWSWHYTIDGPAHYKKMSESRGCVSHELAVEEALNDARCYIDSK